MFSEESISQSDVPHLEMPFVHYQSSVELIGLIWNSVLMLQGLSFVVIYGKTRIKVPPETLVCCKVFKVHMKKITEILVLLAPVAIKRL